jgi:methylglyoxal synthase
VKNGNKDSCSQSEKKIALIAQNHKKPNLLEWVRFNKDTLLQHELCTTGITGYVLESELGLEITIS